MQKLREVLVNHTLKTSKVESYQAILETIPVFEARLIEGAFRSRVIYMLLYLIYAQNRVHSPALIN